MVTNGYYLAMYTQRKRYTINKKNHWMNKANPWSRCRKRNALSNKGIFMILPPQYFPGWIRIYVWFHFSKGNTVEVSLEGTSNSLVKSSGHLIAISFQGAILSKGLVPLQCRSKFMCCRAKLLLSSTQEQVTIFAKKFPAPLNSQITDQNIEYLASE